MRNFLEWYGDRQCYETDEINGKIFLLGEIFDTSVVRDYKPIDGSWQNNLQSFSDVYHFKVPGDMDADYKVSISGSEEGVSVSFARDNRYSDTGKGVQKDVMYSVLHALGEYFSAKKPRAINWTAVSKSRTGAQNREARAHIYDKWATRHLFPHLYVGMDSNWIRRDVYESEYVTIGYPPIPPDVTEDTSASVKAKVLEKMRDIAKQNHADIENRRVAEDRRREEEAERRRQERLQQAIVSPEQNPGQIQVGDIVFGAYEERLGKVKAFQMGNRYREDPEHLYASVTLTSEENPDEEEPYGYNYIVLATQLQKETPEAAAERRRRRAEEWEALLNNPEHNPHGVREGDEIITMIDGAPASRHNGLTGKIVKIQKDTWGVSLKAQIAWDDRSKEVLDYQAERPVSLEHLRKATPEQLQAIERARRQHHVEQQIERSRERSQRRAGVAQSEPEDTTIATDTTHNPQGFKVGDYVKVDGGYPYRNIGRSGIIVRMHRNHWNQDILADVKFHNSRAQDNPTYRLVYLRKDDSEEAQRMAQRQQSVQLRQQRIQQAVGNLQIGDTIRVTSGMNNGRLGRILSFQTGTQNNVRLTCIDEHGQRFSAGIRNVQRQDDTPNVA